MDYVLGLGNSRRDGRSGDLLFLEEGEEKRIRILTESSEIPVWKRHYIRIDTPRGSVGYINCFGPDCKLCKRAEEVRYRGIITPARNYFAIKVIDRTYDTVKLFEGGEQLEDKLLNYSRTHKGITGVDFNISRAKKGYKLIPIPGTECQLSDLDKKRADEVDIQYSLRRGKFNEDDILELIDINMPD